MNMKLFQVIAAMGALLASARKIYNKSKYDL